ncbi:uncharacterized protein LOC124443210 [Xenia sp. Carnegie-2017]|uniref:uncharacterized protein LOC124443210 n=1 Tax=Xenia sp. Carnegie-2017 TaxID=2897299 RepID=UPI001F03C240|nr:uncharacterized protein LOC124443210 [Xenia sp. Carnegie-2017]
MQTMFATMRVFVPLLMIIFGNVISTDARSTSFNKETNLLDNVEREKSNDTIDRHYRGKRFVRLTNNFGTIAVHWTIVEYSTQLTKEVQKQVFTDALHKWESVAKLIFYYTSDVNVAKFKIYFKKNHFNPKDNIFVETYNWANEGEMYLNDDKTWVTNTVGGANLNAWALHKIGVVLGVKYSTNPNDIMYPAVKNTKLTLTWNDIVKVRQLCGKCLVRDVTAVLHDRFGDYHDTLLVINNDHVWRIYRDSGTVYKTYPATNYYDIWPKHIRTFYGMWDGMFDKVFPLRAAHFIENYGEVHLFGQKHLVRKIPNLQRPYNFDDFSTWHGIEGPLFYGYTSHYAIPTFFTDFLKSNEKFGSAYQDGQNGQYWQNGESWSHFFVNGTHYKVSMHNHNVRFIQDMSIHFPGAPRNPDASWFDRKTNKWFFFSKEKYYTWDNNQKKFVDRGLISNKWPHVC